MPSKLVRSGDPARFTCGLIRGHDVTFSWTRNGNVLLGFADERIRTTHDIDTSVLIIRKTLVSDAGNYSCIAKNFFSEGRTSAVLQVEGMTITMIQVNIIKRVIYVIIWLCRLTEICRIVKDLYDVAYNGYIRGISSDTRRALFSNLASWLKP